MIHHQKKTMEHCSGCGAPITDRYILRIRTDSWHESCAVCCVCGSSFDDSCFVKEEKLYCRYDYCKLYGARCSGCAQPIVSNELIMRALAHVYHLSCFLCCACGQQLKKGDHFVLREGGQLLCRYDYERELSSLTFAGSSPYSEYGTGDDDCCGELDCDSDTESMKGAKRPRTILTTSQRRRFKAAFELNPKPTRKVREALAAETGLSVRVVQVWFQNQRAKVKKLARRTTQSDPPAGTGNHGSVINGGVQEDSCSNLGSQVQTLQTLSANGTNNNNNNSKNGSENGLRIKEENLLDTRGPLCPLSMESDTLTLGGGMKSDSSSMEDPMDKLYSMQSSYFT